MNCYSGDIGYYNDNQEWFIVDRIKELIKYKGFQVPPADVEKVLLTHPDIMDAGVIGVPDVAAGELPMAFVVKKRNSKLTEKDVIDFVAGEFAFVCTNFLQIRYTIVCALKPKLKKYFDLKRNIKSFFLFFLEKMSYAKRLHGGVNFIKEIPKNISGKILRRELKKLVTKGKSKL